MRSYVDIGDVVAAFKATAPDVVYAIRNIGNPNVPAIGEWSSGDVAAHLIDVMEAAQPIARGEGTPFSGSHDTAANNEARLAARSERDPRVLAGLAEKAFGDYIETLEAIEGDPTIPWADLKVPVSAAVCVELAECLVHGYDIAHAEGQPWRIDPRRAAISAKGLSPIVESYVDEDAAAGLTATYALRLRGQWELHYVFENGRLSIEEPSSRKVDVHISADPVAFMLVGYGRIAQWGPMAKGRLLAWGRKPWLALKFAKLLKNP